MKHGPYDKHSLYGYAPGVFPSVELLRARPDAIRELLYRTEGGRNEGLQALLDTCMERNIAAVEAPRLLERIAGRENCYAAAVFEKYEDTLSVQGTHVVLCGISDMGNLGTIARTCLGFGIGDIAIIRPAADHFDPRVVRASMGAVFRARIQVFDDFPSYEAAAGRRSPLFFRLQNAAPLPEISLPEPPLSLVFGNESSGLTGDLLARDTGVMIPQDAAVDSLNLSVAVGIGLYDITRRS